MALLIGLLRSLSLNDTLSLDYDVVIKISCLEYFIALNALHALSSIYNFLAGLQKVKFAHWYLDNFILLCLCLDLGV